MAPAPLDTWVRLFRSPGVRVGVRYLPRLAFALAASAAGTILTLPERVVTGVLIARARRRSPRLEHGPGVVVILGYYRTGTTHLHYLLSCDPRFRSPRWCEAMAPQGFALSWGVLRIAMAPFLSNNRPQDDVSIGPEWPAEDDFATSNWALASALPGRLVAPGSYEHFARFHDLEGLTDAERSRWRRAQFGFLWKMAVLAGRRMILLKTPSHTARVRALSDLLGEENVRFVHISREAGAVVRSNVRMAERLQSQLITDPADPEAVRAHVTRELDETERKYDRETAGLGAQRVVEIRYEDLVADPLRVVKRVYEAWELAWDGEAERRMRMYLAETRGYKAAGRPRAEREAPVDERLGWLRERFGHDRPAMVEGPLIEDPRGHESGRGALGWVLGVAAAVLGIAAVWLGVDWARGSHRDWLIMPAGYVLGLVVLRLGRRGSVRKGLFAAGVTLVVYVAMGPAGVYVGDVMLWPAADRTWDNVYASAVGTLLNEASVLWAALGLAAAYRVGSRKHARPPGR